jgi:hypothetical protein
MTIFSWTALCAIVGCVQFPKAFFSTHNHRRRVCLQDVGDLCHLLHCQTLHRQQMECGNPSPKAPEVTNTSETVADEVKKSNDKCGIRWTTFAVDITATTGTCFLTHNTHLLITKKVMPTKCHKRMHSTGTVRGPVLRLSNKCQPDLPKSHLPYIFPAFTVAYLIPELRWKL